MKRAQAWLATPLDDIDGVALEHEVARFNKQVYKMERGLEANKVRCFQPFLAAIDRV